MPKTDPSKNKSPQKDQPRLGQINPVFDAEKIKDFNSKSVDCIMKEQIENALEILKTVEVFLEANIIETKSKVDKKILTIILHNIACCYQKIKDFDNCIAYLEAVIYHFDNSVEIKHKINLNEEYFLNSILSKKNSQIQLKGDFILELRFSAKFHLQMCAVLSQANRHVEALNHAKLAMLMCEDNLIKTYFLYYQIKENMNGNNNNNGNNIIKKDDEFVLFLEKINQSQIILKELYTRITSLRKKSCLNNNNNNKNINRSLLYSYTPSIQNKETFDSYIKYRETEIDKHLKNISIISNIRTIFGPTVTKDDWIQLLNIGNIMYLSALNYEDLDLDTDPKYELLRDAILEKLVMLTVAYFSLATELRFLSNDKTNNKTNGEFYHSKAVEFASLFLPVSCPIVKHYILSYYKHYGNDMEIIQEGEILNSKIELLRSEIEVDKDVLTFITTKKVGYTQIQKQPTNEIENNQQQFEMFPNNNLIANKSKIKDEKAPKFKLNFMNLNHIYNNSNNNSNTFINHSGFKDDSNINNSNINKEYIPPKSKLNKSHQSNSLNNSKLYSDRSLIKHKSKTERIKITKMYINKHPQYASQSDLKDKSIKELNNSNINLNNSNYNNSNNKSKSNNKNKKTERAKSSNRIKSSSGFEISQDKCKTQRGFYGNSINNVYSKSKPNSKTHSNINPNNSQSVGGNNNKVQNKSQTFNMGCFVKAKPSNNSNNSNNIINQHNLIVGLRGNGFNNHLDGNKNKININSIYNSNYMNINGTLINKIFSNRKKSSKDKNMNHSNNHNHNNFIYPTSGSSLNSLIKALGAKMKK